MQKRKRTRIIVQRKPQLASSTAWELRKNPDLFKNILEYEPDPVETRRRRMEREKAAKEQRLADKWAELQAMVRELED